MSIGEGNGNPLQCSCLENPRDGGAWWAAVYGVAQSRTRLKRLSSSSSSSQSHNLITLKDCGYFLFPGRGPLANDHRSQSEEGLRRCSEQKGNAKECSNYHTIALISHSSKVMLKNLQARLQQYVNCELSMLKLDLQKAEKPEIKLSTSYGSSKKQESSQKTSISAFLTMPKPQTVWITINCGKF